MDELVLKPQIFIIAAAYSGILDQGYSLPRPNDTYDARESQPVDLHRRWLDLVSLELLQAIGVPLVETIYNATTRLY